MSEVFDGGEYFGDCDLQLQKEMEIEETVSMLEKMTDTELLDYLCKQGEKLNTIDTFKTYTIAKEIKDNGWTPTMKQRTALIGTAAIAIHNNEEE